MKKQLLLAACATLALSVGAQTTTWIAQELDGKSVQFTNSVNTSSRIVAGADSKLATSTTTNEALYTWHAEYDSDEQGVILSIGDTYMGRMPLDNNGDFSSRPIPTTTDRNQAGRYRFYESVADSTVPEGCVCITCTRDINGNLISTVGQGGAYGNTTGWWLQGSSANGDILRWGSNPANAKWSYSVIDENPEGSVTFSIDGSEESGIFYRDNTTAQTVTAAAGSWQKRWISVADAESGCSIIIQSNANTMRPHKCLDSDENYVFEAAQTTGTISVNNSQWYISKVEFTATNDCANFNGRANTVCGISLPASSSIHYVKYYSAPETSVPETVNFTITNNYSVRFTDFRVTICPIPPVETNLTEGWYTMKLFAGQSAFIGASVNATEAGTYPYNDYGTYGLSYTAAGTEVSSSNWLYVTPNTDMTAIQIVPANGLYVQSAGGLAPTAANINMSVETYGVKFDDLTDSHIGLGFYHNLGCSNKTADIFGGAGSYSEGNRWEFSPVTPAGTIYKVNITNDRNNTAATAIDKNYIVRYNNDAYTGIKNVHNGGFFFIEGAEPTAKDFTLGTIDNAADLDHYLANEITVSIENAPEGAAYDKVINVTVGADKYPVSEEMLNNVKNESITSVALIARNHQAVGLATPKSISDALDETPDFTELPSILTDGATSALPVDGKAYAIINIHKKGLRYFNINNTPALVTAAFDPASTDELPMSAMFICHLVDASTNKYIFANNCGQYLIWLGASTGTDNLDDADGLTADVTASYNYVKINPVSNQVGQFYVNGKRGTTANSESVFALNADGTFNQGGLNNEFYTDSHCSRFVLVEVDYPHNTLTFEPLNVPAPTNGEEEETTYPVDLTYSTIHLPFAVTIPEGHDIHALKAAGLTDNKSITLEEVATDKVIPANTSLVLVKRFSKETENITFAPAATAGTAVGENLLVGHTGTAPEGNHHELVANNGGFVTSESKPAYKALLAVAEPTTEAYTLDVPKEISTTGISEITAEGAAAADVVYDLQGRRVNNASKGIFIVNGKKVLVK